MTESTPINTEDKAERATGPRTVAGKRCASRNAVLQLEHSVRRPA